MGGVGLVGSSTGGVDSTGSIGVVGVTSLDASDTIEKAAGVVVYAIAVNAYPAPFVRLLIAQLPAESLMVHVLVGSVVALIV